MDAATPQFKILHRFPFLAGTKNDGKRPLYSPLAFVAIQPAQVKLHLTAFRRIEVREFQLNHHQAPVKKSRSM